MILVNQKNFSLLDVLEKKARNNIEYCCRSKISLFRLQICPFSSTKNQIFPKGLTHYFGRLYPSGNMAMLFALFRKEVLQHSSQEKLYSPCL